MELFIKHFSQLSTEELFDIYKLRTAVFVVEQKCPYQEIDDADKDAYHIFFRSDGSICAYLRLLPAGSMFDEVSLGRILTAKRGLGLGNRIIRAGINSAREIFGAETIKIKAQTYARGFYEKHGFYKCSEEFLEDGIPHIEMVRTEHTP